MATLDKVIDFSKLSEYDTKIKIHINEVKGDKNNVAFTHGYTDNSTVTGGDSGATGDISNRYFSFRDVRTEDDALTISETENSVSVKFQNALGGGMTGPAETRELPTKQYVDSLVSNVSAASLSVDTLSNPGGEEIKSTITQGDNSTELSYQKDMNNELPNYINARVNNDSFIIPTTGYVDDKIVAASTVGSKEGSSGAFIPATINPSSIGNGSLLVTEANGTTLGSKSLSVTTGTGQGITQVSATNAPTTTSFSFSANNWANRLKGIVYSNKGVATRSESTANETVNITSVTNNGTAITTASKPSDFVENKSIVINTDAPVPGEGALSTLRIYPNQSGFSNLLCGQGIASDGGASVVVGQVCFSKGNANLVVGQTLVNTGNGSSLLGREHFNNRNRVFLAGTGHDTSNGPAECVAAVGQWSDISANTAFAVGNGTAANARSNALEVTTDGKLILRSPNGTRYQIYVLDGGTLTTSQL